MTRTTTVPRLLSLRKVRALTGVSADTIYRWGREGRFPGESTSAVFALARG